MDIRPTEDELDLAAGEFKKTFKTFEKAAKRLISIMESMNKKRHQESKTCFDETERIYKFIIKALDDAGNIQESHFDIKCVTDDEKATTRSAPDKK